VNFVIDTTAIDKLVEELDAALHFSIVVEGGKKLEQVTNYDEVKLLSLIYWPGARD